MHRALHAVIVLWLVSGCSCDPPDVAGDAGNEGVPASDAGPAPVLDGVVFLQLDSGALAELDLESLLLSWPLGRLPARGPVAAYDGELYFYAPSSPDGVSEGSLVRLDIDSGASERLAHDSKAPGSLSLALDGSEAVVVDFDTHRLRVGALLADAALVEPELAGEASAAAYTTEGLVTSTNQGTGAHAAEKEHAEECGALAYRPDDGSLLCGRYDGSAVIVLDGPSHGTLLDEAPGGPHGSLTILEGNDFVGARRDCSVTGSVALPAFGELCPAGFAALGERLFVGLRNAGLLEIVDDELVLRLTSLTTAGGIAVTDQGLVLAGADAYDEVYAMSREHTNLSLLVPEGRARGVALTPDGDLWIADDEGISHAAPGALQVSQVHEDDTLTGAAVLGRHLYVAGDGVKRLSLDDPQLAPEMVLDVTADAIAACGAVVIVHDADAGDVLALSADGTSQVELPEADLPSGNVDALGCVGQHLLFADGARLYGRELGLDGAPALLVELDEDIAFLAGAEID